MGLFLRYNLFHKVSASLVYGAYCSFYEKRGRPLQQIGSERQSIDFYCEENDWTVVDLDAGWEWKERREAQLLVSRRLGCSGFLIFVFDGDYWGYEFFNNGVVLDHFVQESEAAATWFPSDDCKGNAEILVKHLPPLKANDVVPYLIQKHDWAIPGGMDVPARPGDQNRRFNGCAVLDFLRMLGVRVEVVDGYVTLQSQVFRSVFKV
jgi:hypothetical protein